MENISSNSRVLYFIILASSLLAAVLIRAPGLGKWCLNEDEYYYSQPVAFILETGVPQYPGGGYYTRGFGLQYLTVLPALIFRKWEFGARIVPLLFGVLTVPLFFILANGYLGFSGNFLLDLLLLSSWHIEFSRFARFYAPFQFLFLLFIYSLVEGYGVGKKGYRILAFVLGLLSVSIDHYSIFLPLILLSVVVLLDNVERKTALSIVLQASVLIAINLLYTSIDFDTLGVVNTLPPGFVFEKPSPYLKRLQSASGLRLLRYPDQFGVPGLLLLGAGYLLRKVCGTAGIPGMESHGLSLTPCSAPIHCSDFSYHPAHQQDRLGMLHENAPWWGFIVRDSGVLRPSRARQESSTRYSYTVGYPPIKHAIFFTFQKDVLLGGFLLAVVILSTIHHLIREPS
jgi:hypothetical protein